MRKIRSVNYLNEHIHNKCKVLALYWSIFFLTQGVIQLILATDMARHGEILEGFRKVTDNFDKNDQEHLTKLKMILIKACDISNEVRPMDISGPWVECLLEEYFQQVCIILYASYLSYYSIVLACILYRVRIM